jgi:hypothetical protein
MVRRAALAVQMVKLEGVCERKIRQLTSGVLGHPQGSALDRSAEARLGPEPSVALRPCGWSTATAFDVFGTPPPA